MHDLVHDLARAVDKINKNGNVVGGSCQYGLLTDPSKPLRSPENIKALHLHFNYRTELPDGILSPAKNLLVLDISNCLNMKLDIGELKQLRYLRARYIPDRRIPKFINYLPKLNYLNLSRSSMTTLPDSIGDMQGLMHLDLSCCRQLSELPVSFADLKQLVHLDLTQCPVPISESWGGFTKLQYLNLLQCKEEKQDFKVLDEVLCKLTKVEYLDRSCCTRFDQTKVLLEVIGKLTKLQYLDLSFCARFDQTKVLLEVFGKLTKLRYLNLAGCMNMMSEAGIQGLLVGISTLYNLEHLGLSNSEQLNSIPESIGNLTKLYTLDLSGCSIQKLPSWMAKLASLKIVNMATLDECSSNLILFAATNPSKLKISKLEDVKSLEEAQSMKLIEKRRMDDLKLEWTVGCHKRSVDDNKDVLEKLMPPRTIGTLNITGYMSLGFPTNWLMGIGKYLPQVNKITLQDFPNCNNLPPLGQLPNLQYLSLHRLESLEELNTADSCGELMFPRLLGLDIKSCPKFRLKPCLPRALCLSIEASDNMLISWGECVSQTSASSSSSLPTRVEVERSKVPLLQWTLLQHVPALRELVISDCSDLASCSPEVIQRLSSLESLYLKDDILTELPTWLLELSSLRRLTITVPKLEKLNDSTRQLTTGLESLILSGCRSMVSLPQWLGELTSLKELEITECKGIRSLPGSIRPPSLQLYGLTAMT